MKRLVILLLSLYSSFVCAQSLEDYIQIAVDNNPGLQAAHRQYEASLQRVDQATSLPDPGISAGFFVSPVETRVGPQRARIGVSQMLPARGTFGLREELLNEESMALYHAYLHENSKLVYKTTIGYYDLLEIDRLARLEEENISILESYKSMTIKQFENGIGSMVDVLKVDILLKEAKTNLRLIAEKKRPLTAYFNSLLNRGTAENVHMQDNLVQVREIPEVSSDSLVANHHRMIALKHRLSSQVVKEELTKKDLSPRFGVGLDYILVGERSAPNIEGNGRDVLMPSVSMTLPISRKKKEGAINENSLLREGVEMKIKDLENEIIAEYEAVRYRLNRQQQLLELYEEQIETSLRALNLLFTGYGNSSKEFEDVLSMQQQVLKYQKNKVLAMVQFQKAMAELDYITGKH